MQKWAPWEMTPSRNAWPWTRLPMSRPCMSVMATTIVSIWPSRTRLLELQEARVLRRVVVVAHRVLTGCGRLRSGWCEGRPAVPAGPRVWVGSRSGRQAVAADLAGGALELPLDLGELGSVALARGPLKSASRPGEVVDREQDRGTPTTMNGQLG